jgi:hypothetical protein
VSEKIDVPLDPPAPDAKRYQAEDEQPDLVPGQLLIAAAGEVYMGDPLKFDRA